MKKNIYILVIFFITSFSLFSNEIPTRKVNTILSTKEEMKYRLNVLKEKESYIQDIEKKLNKKSSEINLDKKYKALENKYLGKNFNDLSIKKDFLEFEKDSYEELLKRLKNIEEQL